MIDLHFHCLPGIDDGPSSFEEAVALCRAASAEGVESVVATPHVLRGDWINEIPEARDELVRRLNDELAGRPAIFAGCEYSFSPDMLELVERGAAGPLTGLNRGRYLLVELPPEAALRRVERDLPRGRPSRRHAGGRPSRSATRSFAASPRPSPVWCAGAPRPR